MRKKHTDLSRLFTGVELYRGDLRELVSIVAPFDDYRITIVVDEYELDSLDEIDEIGRTSLARFEILAIDSTRLQWFSVVITSRFVLFLASEDTVPMRGLESLISEFMLSKARPDETKTTMGRLARISICICAVSIVMGVLVLLSALGIWQSLEPLARTAISAAGGGVAGSVLALVYHRQAVSGSRSLIHTGPRPQSQSFLRRNWENWTVQVAAGAMVLLLAAIVAFVRQCGSGR